MKFIRDIIAEKTNLIDVDQNQSDPEIAPQASSAQVAEDDLRQAFAPDLTGDEGFDLMADPDETPDQATEDEGAEMNGRGRTELFDGLWAKDDARDPAQIEDAFEFDRNAEDTTEHRLAQTEIEADTKAALRTLYPTGTPTFDATTEAHQSSQETPDSEAEQVEDKPKPAFQKMMERENSVLPPEEPKIETPAKEASPEPVVPISVPTSESGRAVKRAGRVKTRLLGFGNDFDQESDLFNTDGSADTAPQSKFPVGWLVVISGPGHGTAFTLFNGVSQIGRGEDQAVRLDFGDTSISRSNHAAIAYDPEQKKFFLGHGGKANLLRLNDNPVLSTEPLAHGSQIRLGETTLRFVGLCGSEFDWGPTEPNEGDHVKFT